MNGWDHSRPQTLHQLFNFYQHYVKALYSAVQAQNVLPNETLYELNAAFDHLSNHWSGGLTEEEAVAECFSHLKRSCLDVFKIKLKETRDQYDQLCAIDTSVIDNGEFDRRLRGLFNQIRNLATEARQIETRTSDDDQVPAFEAWEQVYALCETLQAQYFLHPSLPWAKRKGIRAAIRRNVLGFVIGVAASLVAAVVFWLLVRCP